MTFFKRSVYVIVSVVMMMTACLSSAEQDSSTAQVEAVVPSPLNLTPGWWIYFNAAGSDLAMRIDKAKVVLNQARESVDKETQAEVSFLVNNIVSNLTALLSIEKNGKKYSFVPIVIKDRYTLGEQFELARDLLNTEGTLKNLKSDYLYKQSKIKDISSSIDKLFISYDNIKEPTNEKMITGLTIMSRRSLWQLTENENKLLSERIAFQEKRLVDIRDALDIALERLSVDNLDAKKLATDIDNARNVFEEARRKLVAIEAEGIVFSGTSEVDRLKQKIQQRKVTNAILEKYVQHSTLGFFEAKQMLYAAHVGDVSSATIEKIKSRVKEWRLSLQDDKQQHEDWEGGVLRDQIMFGQAFAAIRQAGESDNKLLESLFSEQVGLLHSTFSSLATLELMDYNTSIILKQLDAIVEKHTSYFGNVYHDLLNLKENIKPIIYQVVFLTFFKIGDVPVTPLSFFKVVFFMSAAYFISKLIRKALGKVAHRTAGISESNIYTMKRIAHYLIMVMGFFFALGSLGLDFSNFAIILGALSVGVGFGLQSVVNNFLSGLIILFEKNIKVGDFIRLESGDFGKVIAVNVHNTIVHTYDGTEVIIPNAEVVTQNITNWTLYNSYIRIHVPFSVAYGTDKELVRKAVLEAAIRVPCTITDNPRTSNPDVWLVEFGDSALKFELVVWVDVHMTGNHGSITSSYVWEIDTSLNQYGINVPFPQQDIYIKQIPEMLRRE